MELNLSRDVKDSKKGYYKYMGDIRNARKNVGQLLNEVRDLVTQNMEKAEVLHAAFASICTSKTSFPESQVPETSGRVWSKEDIPLVEEDQVREYLRKLAVHKSVGPDGTHSQALKELADVIARPLSVIFDPSWQLGQVPKNWRKANATPIFNKGKEEDPGNYRLISFKWIPGKVIEQLLLETTSTYMKDKKVIRTRQHAFILLRGSHA
ncbi:mitochondrial enolase superfamily member 1 [Grus japonensis]|uniref:Mitochondrial enolase superfamily member 1 n=1 Tax=Grus japonensis TaxID=30415 RepID=A0ABC9X839_GRUJA